MVCFCVVGVLWIGNEILPNAPEVMNKFKSLGKKVFYVTNNSTKSRDEFIDKFKQLGFNVSKVCECLLLHRKALNLMSTWMSLR